MTLKRACAIAGVAESSLGIVPGSTVFTLQAEAAAAALEDAGLHKNDVDGLFCGGRWGRSHLLEIGEYLGIRPTYSDGTVVGGSSFEFHLGHAAAAMKAGLCKVALILYGSTQRSRQERTLNPPGSGFGFQFETPFGLPLPVGVYAMAASRHMALHGTTREQLAEVAVAARQWAALNPKAYRRDPLSIDEVLASEMISDPLSRLDCCLVTDGGGAVVVVHPDLVPSLKKKPVWLLGHGECQSHNIVSQMPDITWSPAYDAGKRAFEMAGVKHDDIGVVQIYDSFTITVLLTLEALGFCPRGEGGAFVSDGRTRPGGRFPMNTSGGGLSYCHPGMFGIFLIIEAVRQLRGECGARQVPDARLSLISGTGAFLSSNSTCILGVD
jgi:acetyl-CoA acetyltransferase